MNKPIVTRAGQWLLPVAFWMTPPTLPLINERDKLNLSPDELKSLLHYAGDRKGMSVVTSTDDGKTFHVIGTAHFPEGEIATEHMVVDQRDGGLWMLARTPKGIASSVSTDRGKTSGSAPEASGIPHPATRFYIGRLARETCCWCGITRQTANRGLIWRRSSRRTMEKPGPVDCCSTPGRTCHIRTRSRCRTERSM